MDKVQRLQQIVGELKRRGVISPPSFLDPNFPKQYAAATDKSALIAVQCTRRAGKSVGFAKASLKDMVEKPGCPVLYGALTLSSAKNILWDVLMEELDKAKIKNSSNSQSGIIRLENNSTFKMFGLDASYKEMRKVLGGKYGRAGLDEAGSMVQDMRKIVYHMITPALLDLGGQLTMMGTAENIPKTFFEKVTSGKEPGWSIHKWTTFDNPYMAKAWKKHIDEIELTRPEFKLTSEYRTHYLNEWCADDRLIIITTGPQNIVEPFSFKDKNPTFILAVDLGYNDACAFTLGAFTKHDPNLYVVEAYKEPEMDITDTANKIKECMNKFPIAKIKVDGANKQGVEEMKKRHNLPLESSDKTDKATFLKILADDVARGRVKYFKGACDSLIAEQEALQWEDETKQREDQRIPNDQNDSFLYMWREARNYLWETKPEQIDKNSDQYMNDFAKRLIENRRRMENEL